MKKFKHLFFMCITLLMCAVAAIPFLNGVSFSSMNADFYYTILDSGMFTETLRLSNHDYTINCYRIKNHDDFIAVSWGDSVTSAPETIDIPSTITSNKPTGSNVDYTVVAIARAGFSRCKSKTITIPQTVKDIREEAFAYCQNLTSFQIPKDVTQIAPSTFLDCRKLSTLYYSANDGKKTYTNSMITSFGDHAFDSCVSLRKVQCPTSAVFFGQSCFQKCATLSAFRFPLDNGQTGDNRNVITVEDYAFADCMSLQRVYFDINMLHISDYAFVDSKSDLTFNFYDTQANFPASLSSLWRNKKITFGTDVETGTDYSTLVYDINYNIDKPVDGGYPGLTVSLSNSERKLDNARTNNTSVTVIPGGGAKYATITRFNTPDEEEWMEGYYEDGKLTIPDTVTVDNTVYPVKVIASGAFENNDDITEVHFNQHLVQICNKAFWHSNKIEILNFDECEDLVEISYSIFNDIITTAGKEENAVNADINKNATIAAANCNAVLTSLTLPNCLQYVGNFAFFNFTRLTKKLSFKTNESQPTNLKLIGDYAFAVYSDSSTNLNYLGDIKPEIDLVLPNSLDDSVAPLANIYHSYSYDRKGGSANNYSTVNASIWNRVAINKNAFENQDGIRTVKMESGGTPHNISFGSNVFIRNTGIVRFEASENLCLLGNEAFKQCSNLREVFLTGSRSKTNAHGCNSSGVLNSTTVANPWGVGDGTNDLAQTRFLFNTDAYYDLVIYVKETGTGSYPLNYPNDTSSTNNTWYTISTNNNTANHYNTSDLGNGKRANIPVYQVDWTTSGNVKYWHINDGDSDELVEFANGPRTREQYNNGYISFCKNSGGNYVIARYFTDGSVDDNNVAKTIDLTSSTLSGMNIVTIGHEAFGGKACRGYYFVLPTSITKIEERAFYRSDKSHGVRIVTFKKNGTVQTPEGSTSTFDQLVTTINGQTETNRSGYCCLPNSVTRLERAAFYNNFFGSVELGVALTFIGNSAFGGNKANARIQSYLFTDYDSTTTTDTNSAFLSANDGIYHKSKKILLHQATGKTGNMTVYTGTTYIGYRAAAGCRYSSITFDSATERIYGQAFKNSTNLTTLINASNIKYISDSGSYPTANTNYDKEDGSSAGNDNSAFEGCTSLKVDFSQMSNLIKIGSSSFKGCTNIVTGLTLSKTYSFSIYSASTGNTTAATYPSNNIMDLSPLTSITNIGGNTFENCSIDYVFTPNTTGTNYTTESKVTFGTDVFKNSGTRARILCGETAQQADQSGTSGLNPTKHYPNTSLRPSATDYSKLYYRVHSTSDLVTANTTRRYWTAIDTGNSNEISILLFESRDDAEDWLSDTTNVNSQRHIL